MASGAKKTSRISLIVLILSLGFNLQPIWQNQKSLSPSNSRNSTLWSSIFKTLAVDLHLYRYNGQLHGSRCEAKLKFFVLDRSNPVGGHLVEGPLLADSQTFVRYHNIPVRHGMTAGELAHLFNKEKKLSLDLQVVPVEGWQRDNFHDATSLPWRNPSPKYEEPHTGHTLPRRRVT